MMVSLEQLKKYITLTESKFDVAKIILQLKKAIFKEETKETLTLEEINLLDLYKSIKTTGFNSNKPIIIYKDFNDCYFIHNGNHRIAVSLYLNLPSVYVDIKERGEIFDCMDLSYIDKTLLRGIISKYFNVKF